MVTNCQSCGNPMFGHADMGLNNDGSINKDFCSDCYKLGNFVQSDEDQAREDDVLNIPIALAPVAPIALNGMGGLNGGTGII